MATQTVNPTRRNFLTAFLPRSGQSTKGNNLGLSQQPEILAQDSELISRRDFGRRSAAGLISLTLLERLFNETEAAESKTGTNEFTAEAVAARGINTQEGLINLASEVGFLPTETDNSKFRRADFTVIADQSDLNTLRQYFRGLEILKNDGFYSMQGRNNDVHKFVEQTTDIKATLGIMKAAAGFRRDDTVIYGLTREESFGLLQHLNSNYRFPYSNPKDNNDNYNKFDKLVGDEINRSLNSRGLFKAAQAIITANGGLARQ